MAQLSKGVRLGYGAMVGESRPTAYTFIPDLTGIPALGAVPSTHQRTTLMDSMHRYIKGLVDVGGNLDFPGIFTDEMIDEVDDAIALQDGGDVLEWCVEFPMPLGRRAYFTGEASEVFNESVDVDAPVTGSVSLVPTSEIRWEAANYTVTFDSNGGSAVAPQTKKYGELMTEPADPTLAGNVFAGWYYDDTTFLLPVAFASDKVDESVTLYAKWSAA